MFKDTTGTESITSEVTTMRIMQKDTNTNIITEKKVENLADKCGIKFDIQLGEGAQPDPADLESVTATYLNTTTGVWEKENLETLSVEGDICTVCSRHLTDFAIQDVRKKEPVPEESSEELSGTESSLTPSED